MSNFAAPIEVINAALLRMGAPDIQSLNDHSKQARIAKAAYEPLVRDWLTRHAWSFATRAENLAYQGETTGRWSAVFAKPADCINIRVVQDDGVRVEYEAQANVILTNARYLKLRAVYSFRAAEGEWSDDFVEGVVLKLQSVFARGLREEFAEADRLGAAAERQFVLAATRDKNQWPGDEPFDSLTGPKLVTAWRGSAAGQGRG